MGTVAEHIGYTADGTKVCEMARSCACGNDFMQDTLFCRKCGLRRSAKTAGAVTAAQSRALVITPEEIERRVAEKTAAAVKAQVAAAHARLTVEITAAVTREIGARLLAEWKAQVDVAVERADTLALRLTIAEADVKAAHAKHAALVAEGDAKVASVM